MLRVLTLSTLYPSADRPDLGGFVERQTRTLAALPDVEVRVVAPRGLPPGPLAGLGRYRDQSALPERETRGGLDVYRPRFVNLPLTAGRFHGRTLASAVMPVISDIRRDFDFDVIDTEFFYPDGPAAIAVGRAFDVPVSIKARGADIHYWGTAPATAHAVRSAGLAADGLLAVSHRLRDDMAALGIPHDRIAIHYTGIDHDAFAAHGRTQAKAALGIGGPLVVSVGALIPRKGHAMLIDAVAGLPGVALHIAGDGPERARLMRRIADHGIGERVRLIGHQPHAALPRLFAAADVMALASSSEGLANAWVESMASGTPIVIPGVGGAHEAVDRPAAGRIVDRDAAAFAAAIGDLLANRPAPDAVRAAARRFSWERNADELRAHLERIVAARRATAPSPKAAKLRTVIA